MESNLSNKQKFILIELVKNGALLLQQYEYLITLEGKKNIAFDYQSIVRKITNLVSKESDLFANLNISKAQYYSTQKFLENYGAYFEPDLIDDLIYEDGPSLIVKRLMGIIKNNIVNGNDFFDMEKEIGMSDVNNKLNMEEIFDYARNMIVVKNGFQNDVLLLLLSDIEREINDFSNKDIIDNLITAKYKLIYTNFLVEKDMIANNFKIMDSLYLSSKLISDSLGLNPDLYEMVKDNFIDDLVDGEIKEIILFTDEDLKEKDYKTEIILRLRYLEAGLVVGDDANLNDLLDDYDESIEEMCSDDSLNLKEKIYDSFEKVPEKRAKHKILSLKI